MDETGDMRIILNGDNAALGFGTGLGASQVSPRAERAARRERERERRLRELGHDIAQRPPGGFVIDPMYVPVTITRRAVVSQTQRAPTSPTEVLQRTGPVAGPSNATGVMMTEAAVQQQQRLQEHHRIVDSDWLYVAPPRAQIEAGPSRNSWHADVAGDESDMILG